jgi:hypothetical protein
MVSSVRIKGPENDLKKRIITIIEVLTIHVKSVTAMVP